MLKLGRKVGKGIVVDGPAEIVLTKLGFAIEAPASTNIIRSELQDAERLRTWQHPVLDQTCAHGTEEVE